MKQFIVILFLLVYASLNAQPVSGNKENEGLKTDSLFQTNLTGEVYIEYRGYKGDQYYFSDWVKSDILLSSGEMLTDRKLKYNGLLDEVIWLNTAIPGLYKLDKASISDIWFKPALESPIHFKRININESSNPQRAAIFAQVVEEGKISLYIQRKISILEVQTITRNGKLYPYKIIGPAPEYYIKISSNKYFLMTSLNRNSLLKVFPDQKKEILKLQRQNHINLKTESGLCEMIRLLNK
jgi:hypothetical protein